MTAILSKDALLKGIKDVQQDGGGVLSLAVIRPIDAVGIIGDALVGDPLATKLFEAINKLCLQITDAPKCAPILCVSCPRDLRDGAYSFVIALPNCDDPTRMIGMAVCSKCATEPPDITTKALLHLRKIWPDLRPINVTHADGGRA